MAPTTRDTERITPPPGPSSGKEADTIKRCRFFDYWDRDHNKKSMNVIAREAGTTAPTGRRWLQQRRNMGSMAYRSTRKRSKVLGAKSRISKTTCEMLVNPNKNPVRKARYEAQIEYHHLPIGVRQLRRKLEEHVPGSQRFKCAFVKKVVSGKNRDERKAYGLRHKSKNVDEFWSRVIFTDEAHIDPTSLAGDWILRRKGQRYADENIVERPPKTGVRFHIAAWVSWHAKAEKLIFYNDEEDFTQQPDYPKKPRRRPTTESEEQYTARVQEWEAGKPHAQDVRPQGNSMTQKYYCENLLPIYIDAIQTLRAHDSTSWILQEDNDPSHGKRKEGLAQGLKRANWIPELIHPAQSPDLNPIEACWNIIKQRLRRRVFGSEEEIKAAIQEEWDAVTMEEIRRRINCMPDRCARLVKTGGRPIKDKLW